MVVTQAQESVTVNGRKPSHHEIAETLRNRIRSGELQPGSRLPTQGRLAEEFGVERGTVRLALKMLQDDGLLKNVTKGAPPQIAPQAAPSVQAGPQPTMVGLGPQLVRAFSRPHVRIDALSLTSETLMIALGEPLRRVHEGTLRPESIHVRLLLPSRDIDLAFPVPVEGDAEAVHKRWLDQRNAQGQVLRHNLLALRATHDIDVQVTFRALPFTPPVKLYLLNGSEALFAYYMIMRREESMDGRETVEMYDTLGTKSLLFSFEKPATGEPAAGKDSSFVEESQSWFDALWNTIAGDLTLS
ncbi:winged helix-turn-helix domain-containing protein [Streptomyces indicus]|uniref:Regulatory protein, gntR family n=1 Tax=Streptomyces indicus TaxID=417292 RepID=A0A1G9HB02_9ACTN|nr:winged helix-turn-helix domain-containing protein [Streptomyces indicus]SDL09653.1 regulatory protein, gntR family [Streptomyces indicus]